jgi:hypothetical protein
MYNLFSKNQYHKPNCFYLCCYSLGFKDGLREKIYFETAKNDVHGGDW